MNKVLTSILKENAKRFALSPALTMQMGYRTITLTYAQVYDLARKVALLLEENGIGKGDPVLLCAPNSPYWGAVFWGSLLCGARPVPLNIQSTAHVIEKIAEQTQARILFHNQFFKVVIPSTVSCFLLECLPEFIEKYTADDFIERVISEDDIVEIMYTSGTTGDPKGVLLTHKNIVSNLTAISRIISLSPQKDRLLSILPLSHILEQAIGFLLPYWHGAHIIYAHSHGAISELMRTYRITKLVAVPEFLQVIMNRIEDRAVEQGKGEKFAKALRLSSSINNRFVSRFLFRSVHRTFGKKFHTIACGGAPLDSVLEKKWRSFGLYVLQGYGLTETSPVVTLSSYDEHRSGSVGKPISNIEVTLGPDGEILVRGPSVFQGYYKDPVRTAETFTKDGWFKTGDIGEFDSDTFLFLRGRKKYMILGPGGQNVFPDDIEVVLNKQEGVQEGCIIGLEKGHGNVLIHAVLLLKEPMKDQEVERIITATNNQLASYQRIGGWTVWDEDDFPRTATRKVKKDLVKIHIIGQKKPISAQAVSHATKLVRILAAVTGIASDEITENTKIVSELNLDSLMRVELVARIEEDLHVFIDDSRITRDTTVAQLEKLVKTQEPIKEKKGLKKWPRMWWACWLRFIAQLIIFPILRIFFRIKVEGEKNLHAIPFPVIFMPNHISYLDSLAVCMALPINVRNKISFAAAHDILYEEYRHFAGIVEFIFNAFPFPRKEHENIKVGLLNMGKILDKDFSVVMFPEGKISEDAMLLPLKRGAGLVAVEMGVPVVPVKISGTEKIAKYGSWMPTKRSTVTIRFGKPLTFKKSESYIEVTEKLQKVLAEL